MKHTIDDVKTVNPEFRMYHNRIGLFNSHFQNFKQFGVPKAQLILTDIPYNIGKNAYGSNPVWYVGGWADIYQPDPSHAMANPQFNTKDV